MVYTIKSQKAKKKKETQKKEKKKKEKCNKKIFNIRKCSVYFKVQNS